MYAIRFIAAVLVFACPFFAFAQTPEKPGKISGKIINELKKPVEYATVTLLRTDSTVVNGSLTDEAGNFSIEQTGTGDFLLRVSGIGINARTVNNINITAAAPEKKMGIIEVVSTASSLKQVEVTAERAMIEMTAEKKVFNVEKNITSSGGSAADVLQNVPSLTIDSDGDVLLRGKETTLLIDGKPATLLAGDIATALQALPGASIQSVEVITNPSAKYDAQGMSGIINIITKKDKKLGFNGSVTAGAGTRDKYNGGINLNLKNDKWNVFLNSNFRSNRNYHRTTTDREDTSGRYNTFEDNIRQFGGFFNTIGAEYTIDQKNTVTLTQNLNRMRWGGNGTSEFEKFGNPIQQRSFEQVGGPFSTSTSLDYKHKFAKPAQELTTNVTYAQMWVTRTQTYHTTYFDSNGAKSPTVFQNAPGQGGNKSLNAQADFTTPFLTKAGRLDAGLKTQLFWFNSDNDPTIDTLEDDNIEPKTDSLLLNNYDYTQHVHAIYSSFSDQYKNWTYNAGLRLEYATYEGTSLALNGNKFTNDYLGLFPSAFVSYKLPKDQAVNLSYTRRTNRPHFMQLMPYVDVSNPQETSQGNPALIPEFIHNTELSYNRQIKGGHSLMASVYYQYTQNLIERVRSFNDNGTSFSQPQNLDYGTTYGLELTGRTQILPMWDLTANANFFKNEVSGTNIDPTLNNSGYSWFGKANTNLRLPAGFSLQLNGNYEAPKVAAQGSQEEAWWLDAAVRKNLWNNRATLVVNVSDIFNTRKYTNVYDMAAYYQTVYKDRETRIGNVTFTYRFGKSEQKNAGGGRRGRNNAPVPQKDRNNLKTDDNSEQAGF